MSTASAWRILIASILLGATAARAMEPPDTDWLLDRIVSNLEQRLLGSPDDHQLHYNLGRAHAFAFALKRSSLWASDTQVGLWIKDLDQQRRRIESARGEKNTSVALDLPPPTPEELLVHLFQGVQHLARAVELADHESSSYPEWKTQYELCLGWLLETGAHLASRVDTHALFALDTVELSAQDIAQVEEVLRDLRQAPNRQRIRRDIQPVLLAKMARYCAEHRISSDADEQAAIDTLLAHYWREQAIDRYRKVVERSIVEMGTTRKENQMMLVREARDSLIRLVEAFGYRDSAEEEAVAGMQARVATVEQLKSASQWITPILLSLDSSKSLDEVVAPNLAVSFDLDGDAVDELWPWLSPTAGWLVWDPQHRGEITSGLQLFGTASAWLFFPDGYRVLDALDDDGNGELRGPELAGIAVWFDRDTDGVSDRGEVVSVEELGIVAFATEPSESIGHSLCNPCGLELVDGRVLPTYDWVIEHHEP